MSLAAPMPFGVVLGTVAAIAVIIAIGISWVKRRQKML